MSEPEIARRCASCGASVRKRAMFCPQCGNQVSPSQQLTTTEGMRGRVEEGVRGRVEKIRKVSTEVIDQAAYDPSLRFLLVAAVLFLLFIVLVILSKVIG